jgi:hypothetical protein
MTAVCTSASVAHALREPAPAPRLRLPGLAPWRSVFARAWQRHRERVARRALTRSLQGLNLDTLRDIGLADDIQPLSELPRGLSLMNYERGLW